MAVIKSGVSTDQLTIDPVSKAARTTLYDAYGNPTGTTINPFGIVVRSGGSQTYLSIDAFGAARVSPYSPDGMILFPLSSLGRGIANVLVRQTAATVAGTVVWAIRNPNLRVLSITGIYLQLSFDGTGTNVLMRYELIKGTGCTGISGGVVVVPLIKRTSIGQSGADIHVLDTGLTLTGVTLSPAFHTMTWGRMSPSTSVQAASPQHRLDYSGYPIELAQNEVLVIRNGPTNNSVIGDTLVGSMEFVEG